MNGALRIEVEERFGAFLSRLNFRETHYLYDAEQFGNEILEFRNLHFAIRFIRDRAQIFLDAKGSVGDFQALDTLLARLGIVDPGDGRPYDPDAPPRSGFGFAASHLMSEWPRLARLLGG